MAEDHYVIQSVNQETFLLNTQTGESRLFDADTVSWLPIQMPTDNTTRLAGELRVLCGDPPGHRMISPVPAKPGIYAEAKMQIANTTLESHEYNVAAKLSSGSKVLSINVFHLTEDRTMSGETLPPPESVFAKDTAYFDLKAKPRELLFVYILFEASQPEIEVDWRVRDELGGADNDTSGATRIGSDSTPTPSDT
jgi:hypothetical protein